MKILHFIYDDHNNPWMGGGGCVRTYELYSRFSKENEIEVVTSYYPGAKRKEKIGNILYRRVGLKTNYLISRMTFSLCSFFIIAKNNFDIAIEDFSCHSPCFVPLFTRKTDCASIQNLHAKHTKKRFFIVGYIAVFFEWLGLLSYKNFVSVSLAIDSELKKRTRNKRIELIEYGVEDNLYGKSFNEKNYILYIGRLDIYQKGLDILLPAFKEVLKENNDLKLIMAGKGNDEKKVKKMVKELGLEDNVEFSGRVSGGKKAELIGSALFVCMPSRFESWGIVAVEAGACGRPVIGTNVPGLNESIRDKETGFLVKKEDMQGLADCMAGLIKNKDLRKAMGAKGRLWAQNFRWSKIAQKQERYYMEVLNEKSF